jgi:NADH:ubiquinone oxidoreductase subunit 3 (subunit A)/NADH:ubiquinone oxidoreductase subunit 6 (subunit J)
MELLFPIATLKSLLPLLAIIAGIFVISTKNAIISVFNLIVLYVLVAFYLIYIGVTYLGLSYIIIYIGAIAILFLFIIMMIDIEVVEKRSNNYLPLLFLLLGGFVFSLKNILYNIGLIKIKSVKYKEELILLDNKHSKLFNIYDYSEEDFDNMKDYSIVESIDLKRDLHNYELWLQSKSSDNFFQNRTDFSNNYFLTKSFKFEEESLLKKKEYNYYLNNNYNNYFNNENSFVHDGLSFVNSTAIKETNYLLVIPNWDSALNRITQITAVGDVLYTVYHSYIYILSIILLLGMIGAIILTADSYQEIRIINKSSNIKKSSIYPLHLFNTWNSCVLYCSNIKNYINLIKYYIFSSFIYKNFRNIHIVLYIKLNNVKKRSDYISKFKKNIAIPSFFHQLSSDNIQSEDVLGNLIYFILANLIIALLLLSINYYFSLSVKYLEKGGGFECGFTSFVQTRERFNIIFYRVSLLFLVFDLEIILTFPYTAIYQKNQNISKNNVLIFLYILIIGFIYELKEGALNIVKKAHSNDINKKKR